MSGMASPKKIVIGNWKMNPESLVQARAIFSGIKKKSSRYPKTVVAVCPPYIYLAELIRAAGKGKVALGSQDIFHEDQGSYTGEVGARLVRNLGARYAIVGHSERRRLGEGDASIARKVAAGLKSGLSVVLCVGEHTRDDHGMYLAFVHDQLVSALQKTSPKLLKSLIIAYEPVWAIGRSAADAITPRHLHEMVLYIRKVLVDEFGPSTGKRVPILYGGSVFANNAREFLVEGEADGLLVGRESLKPDEFAAIIQIAHEA